MEYGLLVAALAAVVVAVVFAFGGIVRDALTGTGDCLQSGGRGTSCPSATTGP